MHVVIDGIERAHGKQVQVTSFRIERRVEVAELSAGRRDCFSRRHLVQPDRAVARTGPEREREPRSIGRPRELFAAAEFAARDDTHHSGVEVREQHLVAMIGERDAPADGCRFQGDDPADIGVEGRLRRSGEHLNPFLT